QPSLGETSYNPCPRCHGTGHIRGTESSALHNLRNQQEEAMKENTGALHVQLPVDVATFLLNEKRVDIHTLESRLKVNVVLIPNIHMETPHYTIARLRHDELNLSGAAEPSYKMATLPETEAIYQTAQESAPARQIAAVKSIAPPQPVAALRPVVPAEPQAQGGLFERIFGWLKKRGDEAPAAETAPVAEPVAALARGERPSERRDRKPGQRRGRGEPRNGEARQQEPRQSEAREGRGEARGGEQTKQPRPPRQPKPRPEAEAAPRVTEAADAPREAGSEEKREGRSRRGRGNRRPREARPETAASTGEGMPPTVAADTPAPAPARFRAIIEIAGAPKAAPATVAPAQQALQLEATPSTTPLPTAVTASPATILADLAASTANLQQVETQAAAASTAETSEAGRPRRRRRPTAKPAESDAVSLMQVETSAPVTNVVETPAPAALHPTRRRTRPQVNEVQEPLVQVETQAK
ncbi:MAG: ribonuclease E/G, partial [Thiobacillus sp.]|nr:ribonuclease E/G [Thiobacillus sp.]